MSSNRAEVGDGSHFSHSSSRRRKTCFLCLAPDCVLQCPHCKLVNYCCEDHYRLHRIEDKDYCFPYEAGYLDGVGRILRATRSIKALEVVLVDPGSVTGPNYSSRPVCLECLLPVNGKYACEACRFPMCSEACASGSRHKKECGVLARCVDWPDTLKIRGFSDGDTSNAYSVITPLRTLLLQQAGGDHWRRSDQLMDHLEDRSLEEWEWYEKYIVNFISEDLKCGDSFTKDQIRRAVGLLNVNAVALNFPRTSSNFKLNDANLPTGKGLYPIFAIMSHYCICNARYMINPKSFEMFVRARRPIRKGEEISVQYLSALYGNFKRRRKIRADWHFDCLCKRCSDPTECGSFISAIKCFDCGRDRVLPSDPLDYDSQWRCGGAGCPFTLSAAVVEKMVDGIEEELNEIVRETSQKNVGYDKYEDFIAHYSNSVLHANHYLIMTAKRNLIQFYTYASSNEVLNRETVRRKLEHCQDFYNVLTKVDPGYSEIRNFVQSELNFCRLYICQQDFQQGKMNQEEYLSRSRQSLAALEEVQRNKKMVQFGN